MTKLENIIVEVTAERQGQYMRGFTDAMDDCHSTNDWVALIARHVGLAVGDGADTPCDRFRRQMIRVATLAVAAVESTDRNTSKGWVQDRPSGPGY